MTGNNLSGTYASTTTESNSDTLNDTNTDSGDTDISTTTGSDSTRRR